MTDTTALVTGAAGAIGAAIADRFASEGRAVIVADVDHAGAEKVATDLRLGGAAATSVFLDVTQRDSWRAALEVAQSSAPVGTVVNNAGITRDAWLTKMTDDQWSEVIDVHLRGTFLGSQLAVGAMAESGTQGSVVNISSITYLGSPGQGNYSAAKGGIVSLTRTAAIEAARFGVRVNAVAPGSVDTPMLRAVPKQIRDRFRSLTPLGRFAEPREIADAVCFLASDRASYITGQILHVCGGASLPAQ